MNTFTLSLVVVAALVVAVVSLAVAITERRIRIKSEAAVNSYLAGMQVEIGGSSGRAAPGPDLDCRR